MSIHLSLELAGQAILLVASRHLCHHRWHRWLIWGLGTLALAVATVLLIG